MDGETHDTEVLLKVMDSRHQNCMEVWQGPGKKGMKEACWDLEFKTRLGDIVGPHQTKVEFSHSELG